MYNSYKRKCMDRRDFIIHFCIGKHLYFKKKYIVSMPKLIYLVLTEHIKDGP